MSAASASSRFRRKCAIFTAASAYSERAASRIAVMNPAEISSTKPALNAASRPTPISRRTPPASEQILIIRFQIGFCIIGSTFYFAVRGAGIAKSETGGGRKRRQVRGVFGLKAHIGNKFDEVFERRVQRIDFAAAFAKRFSRLAGFVRGRGEHLHPGLA